MLIQDIKPMVRTASTRQPAVAKGMETEVMVTELFTRGVSIEDIFGIFYALEAMADARADEIFGSSEEGLHGDPNRFGKHKPLTVGDALLAGVVARDINTNPIPF